MATEPIRIALEQIEEDRFSRFRLIPWWNQEKIARARVLLVGAGALGNEILKNLILLGFRQVVVVDLDRLELSNLSRAVLCRKQDIGKLKAEAVAAAARELEPDLRIQPLALNVVQAGGLGLFDWSDLVIAGLDNREARLWINRSCWLMNRPWIDGAIEGINGVARVFLPGQAPCYECTLGEVDWALLNRRMSCNLLLREAEPAGKVPTTPTISSIIAGIQVQEAVKLLHGLPTLASRGFVFEGLNHTSYVVQYTENPDCTSHYTLEENVRLPQRSSELTLHSLHERACRDLASQQVAIEFSRDVISSLDCPACGESQQVLVPVGSVTSNMGRCLRDGEMRVVRTVHSYDGASELGGRTLDQLGLPPFDLFIARSTSREIGYLIAGDETAVLGPVAREVTHE
jgi:molybdopterin/thiamine biosynthesis adenylyltransferase